MSMDFPRGSEWRKWDLHVHAPGTKLSDGYTKIDGGLDWAQFCQIIHDSDVAAIGIADYFSLDGFFEFKNEYATRYPNDESKVFFPNLELRLPETLNDRGDSVNIHIVFRPDLSESDAHKFLISLDTETTTGKLKRTIACSELKTKDDYESATVTRGSIDDALRRTFGAKHNEMSALVITSAKNDGIRPGKKGSVKRKKRLTDETDKFSHAFFAGPGSCEYFLDCGRLETDERTPAKPVFGGSDAHSFEELRTRLGKHNVTDGSHFHTTWIKADMTYEGLLQTLVEPASRVAIQASQPDAKEPYQYISRIKFSGTDDFPSEVVFNPNLNAIIGSRSSGKSALLAFVAHAVDSKDTVRQQVASGMSRKNAGPAAGKTWSDVGDIVHEVEWGSTDASEGRVIYIPQNSLYSLSEHPDKVTEKIAPSLFRRYPVVDAVYKAVMHDVGVANGDIKDAVTEWFSIGDELDTLDREIRDLGDKDAIEAARRELSAKVEEIKKNSQLTDDEVATYQTVAADLQAKDDRLSAITDELDFLAAYAVMEEDAAEPIPGRFRVTISVRPNTGEFPDVLATKLEEHRARAEAVLRAQIEQEVATYLAATVKEQKKLSDEAKAIRERHANLLAKHAANIELAEVSKNLSKQTKALESIKKKEDLRKKRKGEQDDQISKIRVALAARNQSFVSLREVFSEESRTVDDELTFGIEVDFNQEIVSARCAAFNHNKLGPYMAKRGDEVDVVGAQESPESFLVALRSGTQELNNGYDASGTAQDILTLSPETRFSAELDTDVIGGFGRSTMTPGKQALFALTLILNESQEPWPLLIDQPEDDLDSRSIYDTIVPYLIDRKRERQIIMISHDANLVIGADSEEVIVANRHGADRPNRDRRTFEYLTGSLEHTQPLNDESPTVLGRYGIREHACEILDGGEEAFQKRRDKYKI